MPPPQQYKKTEDPPVLHLLARGVLVGCIHVGGQPSLLQQLLHACSCLEHRVLLLVLHIPVDGDDDHLGQERNNPILYRSEESAKRQGGWVGVHGREGCRIHHAIISNAVDSRGCAECRHPVQHLNTCTATSPAAAASSTALASMKLAHRNKHTQLHTHAHTTL